MSDRPAVTARQAWRAQRVVSPDEAEAFAEGKPPPAPAPSPPPAPIPPEPGASLSRGDEDALYGRAIVHRPKRSPRVRIVVELDADQADRLYERVRTSGFNLRQIVARALSLIGI